ncbi:hypothetical protein GALMADRAFT_153925 [Galerina marginata CBS 339.88]|uniref:Peptidase S53 domain-containing protein n=1 Tax=Galerina marginata (strain CBS 339.88) TaxID=685588 RepID=A0A067TD48_GALM3|nr:hypothetical protein GALMADRAFT_153925 [Galerina marginata CBS 339.88]
MKHLSYLFSVSLILLLRHAAASPLIPRFGDFVVHEKRDFQPVTQSSRRLEGHVNIPLRIGLKQQNLDMLPEHLMAVSDPTSASYGQHWSHEKVVDTFAPSADAHETIRAWLIHAGFDASRLKLSHNKAWIEIQGTTALEAEELLNTEYHIFDHEGEDHVTCHEYSLPARVVEHVDFIIPTIQPNVKLVKSNSPGFKASKARRNPLSRDVEIRSTNVQNVSLAGCDTTVVPSCLRTLYNMTYTPKATDRNTFGIVSYFSNTYLQSDLDSFFRNFSPSLVGTSPKLVSIDGGSIEIGAESGVGEDDWILQYAMTLVQPQQVQLLQVGNQQTGETISFNEWLDAVDGSYCPSDGGDDFTFDPQLPNPFPGGFNDHSCGTVKAPNVVSNSQADHEYRFPQFYRERQCNEFGKIGLMGVTILYSPGNTGTAGAQSGYCLDDNGSMNLNGTHFNPAWPASCPWVTVVGGTQVKANASANDPSPEEVWNQDLTMGFFESGGGGFSNHFAQPAYQKTAVEKYLKFLAKSDPAILKHFNTNGRAFPDLSANANSFLNIENGAISIDSGTSGAIPTVASIITLVNDARISAGKKPVGFINPTIYSTTFATAFNDIVDGTSQGCKGLQGDRGGGFKATPGWDPATGVGTPNLGKLIEKWLSLP